MLLQDGIQRFLDRVEPRILARGRDYYYDERVDEIDWDGSQVTAEVYGSDVDPYKVEIGFIEGGGVAWWFCDCPYDQGDVCKHIVAVLLALQEEAEEKPLEKGKEKFSLRSLVEGAEKEQLTALILEHCQEDKHFQSQVLSELEDTGDRELLSLRELIQDSIHSNSYRGYIDERGCDNICGDLDNALDKAHRRIDRGQYECALDITLFVLLTGVKLAGEADSSSGYLSMTIGTALETVGSIANALAKSGGERTKCVQKLLDTAERSEFRGWDHWCYYLLQQGAVLADLKNEGEFYAVLDRLSDRLWEEFKDSPYCGYADEDKITRYHVIHSARGAEAAHAYLEQNLDVDELRMILVREEMENEDYANAERLCRERADAERTERWSRPSRWQYQLYEIYKGWGQREQQIDQAKKLALLGDSNFYQTAKELLIADGRWDREYPRFLSELKTARSPHEYMEILSKENETALLIEQVRLHPETVFHYGGILAPQYGEEVYGLCTAAILEEAKQAGDRRAYQRVCGLIQSLAGFDGVTEARMLIGQLRQAYPRRPALLDELGRVERKLAKKK